MSYLADLETYELLLLICGEDGYWIYISEAIADSNPDIKYLLNAPELGGLDKPQPF